MTTLDINELGRIAYGAACVATGCKQLWDDANQGKWIAAAKAVQTLVREHDGGTLNNIIGKVQKLAKEAERQRCIDAAKAVKRSKYDDDFSSGMECMRESIIKALEAQSDE